MTKSLIENHFPPIDSAMGLQMHCAPRVIQVQHAVSLSVVVDRSILAGCLYSVPWTKCLIHQGCKVVANRVPQAKLSTYVDDCNQIARGTFAAVRNALVRAACVFDVFVVKACHLKIASKSKVVASKPSLARSIQAEL